MECPCYAMTQAAAVPGMSGVWNVRVMGHRNSFQRNGGGGTTEKYEIYALNTCKVGSLHVGWYEKAAMEGCDWSAGRLDVFESCILYTLLENLTNDTIA